MTDARALPVESAHVMVPPAGETEPPAIAEYRARLTPRPVETIGQFEFHNAARPPDLALAIVTADNPYLRQPAAHHRRTH